MKGNVETRRALEAEPIGAVLVRVLGAIELATRAQRIGARVIVRCAAFGAGGHWTPPPREIDSPPALVIVALPLSNERESKWLKTFELRTCRMQEHIKLSRLKCGKLFASSSRRSTRLLSPSLRFSAAALMRLTDNLTLSADDFPDGVELTLGVVLFFTSDESDESIGKAEIAFGELEAFERNALLFDVTHVGLLSC